MSSIPIRANMEQLIAPYVQDDLRSKGYYLPYLPTEQANIAALSNDETMVTRDVSLYTGLNTMSLQTAGEFVLVDKIDPRLGYILNQMMNSIRGFTRSRKSLVHNGTLFGLSLQKKVYKTVPIKYTGLNWKCVVSLQEVDRRRLRLEKVGDEKYKLQWTIWSPLHDAYMVLESLNNNPYASDDFSTQGFMWFVYEYEESSPYFYGLIDIAYPLILIRSKVIRYWHSLCEAYGEPPAIAKMNIMRGSIDTALGSAHATIEERRRLLMKSLQDMRAAKTIIIDQEDEVRIAEHGSTGNNILREFIEYLDNKIQLLLLGAELTTKAGKSGSYALGSIHKEMTSGQISYNRSVLVDVIKQDLIEDFVTRNYNQLKKLNIDTDISEIEITITSERELLKKKLAEQGKAETHAGIKDI